jgi:hypothetical protein
VGSQSLPFLSPQLFGNNKFRNAGASRGAFTASVLRSRIGPSSLGYK